MERKTREQEFAQQLAPAAEYAVSALVWLETADPGDDRRLQVLESAASALARVEMECAEAGSPGHGVLPTGPIYIDPVAIMWAAAGVVFAKAAGAFAEEMGRTAAAWVTNRMAKLRVVHALRHLWKGDGDHTHISSGTVAGICFEVPQGERVSDDAVLALLDLDLTDERLSGKTLHWDAEKHAWVPTGERGKSVENE